LSSTINLVALPDDYDGDKICLGFALALTLLLLLQSPQCWKKHTEDIGSSILSTLSFQWGQIPS
jgi:hypothetical protein